MDLLQLRHFQVVARFEHISRAAEELRIAQPSLSRTIARLEAELGSPLFERRGRGIRLNEHGELFLRHVDRTLSGLDDATRAVREAGQLGLGRVSLACETLLTVTTVLAGFRADHPRADVRLYQSTAQEMQRQLRVGEVDFCVASQPLTGPDLETVELNREEVLLAVPRGHRLDGRESVTIPEIADEPIVTTRKGHWQRALLDRLFAAEGLTPTLSCEGDEPSVSQVLISAGLGIGLIPSTARQSPIVTGVPVAWSHVDAPGCHRVLTLVWRRDAHLSEGALKFREFITSRPFMTHRLSDPPP
ncbi:LysR family transcriptional regulator [Streptomyces sp. NPDC050085]|uniref:LysR family transcriptional regulator n=1 Tax=Streptomyces sp. NPDC050085 TaxID=3365600 RepID=UPI00378E6E17